MEDRRKELVEKLGLKPSDFEEKVISDETRLDDLESAICELFEILDK